MWIKSQDGKEINKCIRVYLKETKKNVELVGVIACSYGGEYCYVLGKYESEAAAQEALDKVSTGIDNSEKLISL